MNTLKTIFKKLSKEETKLASHEVELGLVDEVKKLQEAANNSHDKAINELKKAASVLDSSNTFFANAIKDSKIVLENIDKARLMAKDLGVQLPNTIDSLYKYYETQIKDSELSIKDINQFKSKLF